ncbi:hypothetical protein, partial [Longimicrobium sp.]|uniref:hypothetical protein n=1 Tax=Longimicrobium sp. TaxID=2029185 RepID=UPI002E358975
RVLGALSDAGLAAGHIEPAWVRRLLAGYNARKHAVAAYQPRVYDGRVVLFAAAEHDADTESARWWTPGAGDPGWHAYASRPLRVHVVPGQHATLATGANAEHVARHLRAAIDDSLSS